MPRHLGTSMSERHTRTGAVNDTRLAAFRIMTLVSPLMRPCSLVDAGIVCEGRGQQDTPGFSPAHLWTALGRPWPGCPNAAPRDKQLGLVSSAFFESRRRAWVPTTVTHAGAGMRTSGSVEEPERDRHEPLLGCVSRARPIIRELVRPHILLCKRSCSETRPPRLSRIGNSPGEFRHIFW